MPRSTTTGVILIVLAVLALAAAFMPGMPMVVFLALAVLLLAAGVWSLTRPAAR